MKQLKDYYVESAAGWLVARTGSKSKARSIGVEALGRGRVRPVRRATSDETRYYVSIKGETALMA